MDQSRETVVSPRSIPQCALCPNKLTGEHKSGEHVIANAIGGRLIIENFICKTCNDRTGHAWDAPLAAQLNGLSMLCDIVRDRGSLQPHKIITTEGEELEIRAEGVMRPARTTFNQTANESGVFVEFTTRTPQEARRILRGLVAKYPHLDIQALEDQVKVETVYPKGWLKESFSVGGPAAGRAIVKSALAMAVHAGLSPADCPEALDYLLRPDAEACFGYDYQVDPVEGRQEGVPLHCVSVRADPGSGLVLAYVEMFGFYRIVVCLARAYQGAAVQQTYAVDPRTGETLDLVVDLDLAPADIAPLYAYERIPTGSLEAALKPVLALALLRRDERARLQAIEAAVRHGFANCGAQMGDELSDDQAARLGELVSQHLTPYLEHMLSRRARNPSTQ